ncbi:hypothetical protein CHY_0396 [Carboxydothermus hydrogenoformans Z-2901]|uniref:Uncharacterized protein n=1 Tax=Carboxydothermus hydrogenoformans (strain ATCC BAA-161 / DSM 6008 / Z-2901) TaxID=246194 RepID=Q3AF27_CARHZ|nr:hypothetical protein CHY_0396 [Carboxydothermus hydrogenoformans Z-2901]
MGRLKEAMSRKPGNLPVRVNLSYLRGEGRDCKAFGYNPLTEPGSGFFTKFNK